MAPLTVWQRIKQTLWPPEAKAEAASEPQRIDRPDWEIVGSAVQPLPIHERRTGWGWVVHYTIYKDGEVQDRGRTRFLREPDAETTQRALRNMLNNWRQEHDKGDMES